MGITDKIKDTLTGGHSNEHHNTPGSFPSDDVSNSNSQYVKPKGTHVGEYGNNGLSGGQGDNYQNRNVGDSSVMDPADRKHGSNVMDTTGNHGNPLTSTTGDSDHHNKLHKKNDPRGYEDHSLGDSSPNSGRGGLFSSDKPRQGEHDRNTTGTGFGRDNTRGDYDRDNTGLGRNRDITGTNHGRDDNRGEYNRDTTGLGHGRDTTGISHGRDATGTGYDRDTTGVGHGRDTTSTNFGTGNTKLGEIGSTSRKTDDDSFGTGYGQDTGNTGYGRDTVGTGHGRDTTGSGYESGAYSSNPNSGSTGRTGEHGVYNGVMGAGSHEDQSRRHHHDPTSALGGTTGSKDLPHRPHESTTRKPIASQYDDNTHHSGTGSGLAGAGAGAGVAGLAVHEADRKHHQGDQYSQEGNIGTAHSGYNSSNNNNLGQRSYDIQNPQSGTTGQSYGTGHNLGNDSTRSHEGQFNPASTTSTGSNGGIGSTIKSAMGISSGTGSSGAGQENRGPTPGTGTGIGSSTGPNDFSRSHRGPGHEGSKVVHKCSHW